MVVVRGRAEVIKKALQMIHPETDKNFLYLSTHQHM